jgi:hypothetical protein
LAHDLFVAELLAPAERHQRQHPEQYPQSALQLQAELPS